LVAFQNQERDSSAGGKYMKKSHNHTFIIWGIILLSLFFSMWLLRILPTEFKGLTIIYVGFVLNYLGAAGVRQKENAWFKKNGF
jgi:hypothetical protein